MLLSLLDSTLHASALVVLIAGCELRGDFSMMMLILKSGLFGQQIAPAHSRAAAFDRPSLRSSPVSERSP
jgi:hypothetical protein